jgi:hypothetical protein
MREQLIGYLIGALEPAEQALVDDRLARDAELQRELELLRRGLHVLEADQGHFEPPAGLADRTCQHVSREAKPTPAPVGAGSAPRGWTFQDFAVAAGIAVAAAMLLFPAINRNRAGARLVGCENNLRLIGMALAQYSSHNGNYFPFVPARGNFAAAGIYAPTLIDQGFLSGPEAIFCPGVSSARRDLAAIPSLAQLRSAGGAQLQQLHRAMGGDYGYSLGYVANHQYRAVTNLHRAAFALVSDAPSSERPDHLSPNHGAAGQNVLFEDGHVRYLTTSKPDGLQDDIFVNDRDRVAAGVHRDDAVIGASDAAPEGSPE